MMPGPPALRRLGTALLALLLAAPGACSRRADPPASGAGSTKVAFAALTLGDALERARSENRLVMVDVYTDWCGWCKKLDSDTYGDARVAAALENVISIRVNAEKGGESVAEKYRVRGFPTVLFLSGSGDIVEKVEGYVSAEEMLRIVSSLRNRV
jgi:thiol:disulfide interchange protein